MRYIHTMMLPLVAIGLLSGCWEQETQGQEQTYSIIISELTKDSAQAAQLLQSYIQEHEMVVIDFYAPWCPPCKAMSPIIDELSGELTDITFIKVDIDTFHEIGNEFNIAGTTISIQSVPTFYFIKNGTIVGTTKGSSSKKIFKEKMKKVFEG